MPAANAEWTAPEYPRPDEPFTGTAKRPMLDAFLDRYRASR